MDFELYRTFEHSLNLLCKKWLRAKTKQNYEHYPQTTL